MNGILKQLTEFINEKIRFHELGQYLLHQLEMYMNVSVILLSHTTCLRFGKTIAVLCKAVSTISSVDRLRFILDNILADSSTVRGGEYDSQLNEQRDQTQQLFEL